MNVFQQMINLLVASGTSERLRGGVLAAVTPGPWTRILVMTAVIVAQAPLPGWRVAGNGRGADDLVATLGEIVCAYSKHQTGRRYD